MHIWDFIEACQDTESQSEVYRTMSHIANEPNSLFEGPRQFQKTFLVTWDDEVIAKRESAQNADAGLHTILITEDDDGNTRMGSCQPKVADPSCAKVAPESEAWR